MTDKLIEEFPFLKVSEDNPWCYGNCEGNNWFYECPEGWRELFYNALKKINQLLKVSDGSLQVHQVKEKFGELRFYFGLSGVNRDVSKMIDNIVWKLEADTYHTCIECGKPATCYTTGWILPFCDDCVGNKRHKKINNDISSSK